MDSKQGDKAVIEEFFEKIREDIRYRFSFLFLNVHKISFYHDEHSTEVRLLFTHHIPPVTDVTRVRRGCPVTVDYRFSPWCYGINRIISHHEILSFHDRDQYRQILIRGWWDDLCEEIWKVSNG
jgi:hypothetical protein